MKIAFLSFYSGEIYRGGETFVHELANHLVDLGVEVAVFQNGPKIKNSKYKTVVINLKVDWEKRDSQIPFLGYYTLLVKKFTELALRKLDHDTDIIFPTNGQWQSVLSKVWAIKNRKRIIISGQSGVGLDDRINLYTFPDYFVSLTPYQMKRNSNRNPLIKHTSIPNGVDLKSFNKGQSAIKLNLQKPIILSVSALVDWKRVDLIINAVSKLNEGSLLIVGKGSEKKNLRELAEKKIPGRYQFLDVAFSDMPAIYKSADLFTFATSPWESFGIVLLEAMASGLGVVATDDPIRREIVGKAGLFVDPTDENEYASRLRKALEREWGNTPREQASKFSWSNIASQYIDLFQKVL